tara:strand:- start:8210 stop:9466 length:1257 start_codon:yes stop_codon:yes gene_type:complete
MCYQNKLIRIKHFIIFIIFLSLSSASENVNQKNKIVLINGYPLTKITSKEIKVNKNKNRIFLKNYSKNFTASYYLDQNEIIIDEIFYSRSFDNLKLKVGKFSINHFYKNTLSTGDMIESGNSLGLPRYYIEYTKILGKFEIKVSLSDGVMDKNSFNTERPFIHDKRFFIKNNGFSLGLIHNVIWGGRLEKYGKQPSTLDDYFRIFAGQGGSETALLTDQGNVLGNAFGVWDFRYINQFNKFHIDAYHQTFFEDRSGLELKNRMSKFDGLTGISLSFNNFKFLFEYLKTTYQGGNTHPPGVDSYYYNGVYENGYIYKDRTIGNIFLSPYKNRMNVKHISFQNKIRNSLIKIHYSDIKEYDISYRGFPPSGTVDLNNDKFKQFSEKSIYFEQKIKDFNLGFFIEKKQKDINVVSKLTFEF